MFWPCMNKFIKEIDAIFSFVLLNQERFVCCKLVFPVTRISFLFLCKINYKNIYGFIYDWYRLNLHLYLICFFLENVWMLLSTCNKMELGFKNCLYNHCKDCYICFLEEKTHWFFIWQAFTIYLNYYRTFL